MTYNGCWSSYETEQLYGTCTVKVKNTTLARTQADGHSAYHFTGGCVNKETHNRIKITITILIIIVIRARRETRNN